MPTEDEILAALRPQVSNATLAAVAAKAAEARDLEHVIADLEQRLKESNAALHSILTEELPNLFDQAQTDRVGIPQQGNMPACDLRLTPRYHANIAAAWPQTQRDAAFQALTDLGHQDLIKTEITLTLPREDRASAQTIVAQLQSWGFSPQVRLSVHFKTLTAWLQEQFEHGNPLPPLATIGASITRIVTIKERKDV